MAEKKIPLNFDVQVYGDLVPYSPTISKARVRIFYRGLNRNYSYISDEFAEKLIKTLPYSPIKGIYDEEGQDFTDHGNGIKSLGKAYGVVPENGNGQWERHFDSDGIERTYYCTDVLLWTSLYEAAKQIPGKCQSMELDPNSIKGDWKEFENCWAYAFEDGCFLGLQVLGSIDGEKVEPCFEGSAFYNLQDTFSEIIKVAKNYNLENKEEPKMPETNDINTVVEPAVEPVANEPAVEPATEPVAEPTAEPAQTSAELAAEPAVEPTAEPATQSSLEEPVVEEPVAEPAAEPTENFEQKYNDTLKELNELKEKYEKLSAEKSVSDTEFEHLKAERDALKEFKDAKETAEKNEVIDKYTAILTDEVIKVYREKLDSYSAIELDKELCFEAHKNDTLEPGTANFSYKNNGTEGASRLQECLRDYKIN